ncbi:LLM class flavin-dependent oxidoreductase [Williamsia soli]|uniref:LLM class flavin-dependent oxidoreductase n=1 Tax=Williamsia soli TaxID=364929 RepID=UPI001A9D0903|nr:LLM class flavin-dependent oxidoreductase [Williamsia soli]
MVRSRSTLHVAVEIDGAGAHPAAWRFWGRPPAEVVSAQALRDSVAVAETAGFALVTFDDRVVPASSVDGSSAVAVGRLDSGTKAAFAATTTTTVGLGPTVQALTTEPFHLATALASLDHASHGRAAWVVGVDNSPDVHAAVGSVPRDPAAAVREARDVVEVARRLWDSWEDDAVIRDTATGRFLDPNKVHHTRFDGEFFSVVGPLITQRPPQGQVVVLADASLGISAQLDIALVAESDVPSIAGSAVVAGDAGAALVFAEVEVVLDADGVSAGRRSAELGGHADWPDTGRFRFEGSPTDLVEALTSLADVVDGVRLHPAVTTTDLYILAREVIPALTASGVHSPPTPGATLRETLGLPWTASRYVGHRRTGGA